MDILKIILFIITAVCGLTLGIKCRGNILNEKERSDVIKAHNEKRSIIAKGNGKAPPAKEMYKMIYDCDVEITAQKYAETCPGKRRSNDSSFAENIHREFSGIINKGEVFENAVSAWWKEIIKNGFQNLTQDLIQLARWNVTKFGCGIKACGNLWNIVCRYTRPVNENLINNGTPPYPVGPSCKTNKECQSVPGSICNAKEGLCLDPIAQSQELELQKLQQAQANETSSKAVAQQHEPALNSNKSSSKAVAQQHEPATNSNKSSTKAVAQQHEAAPNSDKSSTKAVAQQQQPAPNSDKSNTSQVLRNEVSKPNSDGKAISDKKVASPKNAQLAKNVKTAPQAKANSVKP